MIYGEFCEEISYSHANAQTVSNYLILLSSLSSRPRNTDIDHVKILRY